MKHATIEELVNYGLDKIDPSEKVTVDLKDLMYVFKTFEELNRFFHNPIHLKNIDDIEAFLGNKHSGMYHLISQNYYQIIPKMLPEKINILVDEGAFSSDAFPHYYKSCE